MTISSPSSNAVRTTDSTTESDDKTKTKRNPVLPVNRNWLRNLLLKHYGHDGPALVLAPMVDQSDLPFRLLTRRYGCNLCFTPMIHAKLFVTQEGYRRKFKLDIIPASDRPLVAQICGSEPDVVLECASLLQPYCDAIDLNCGCPQAIARRGNYGAYLLEQEEVLLKVVEHLSLHLSVPLSVKVRLLPASTREESVRKSLRLYHKIVDAGAHMLTIHGRTRFHKGPLIGDSDWPAIRECVEALGDRIPILSNGSIGSLKDIAACLEETKADGVMISEAILEYPALLKAPEGPRCIGRVQLAREYLDLAQQYPPQLGGQGTGMKCIRAHLHRILHADLQEYSELRQRIVDAENWQLGLDAVNWLARQHELCGHCVVDETLSWYVRHRVTVEVVGKGDVPAIVAKKMRETGVPQFDANDADEGCQICLFGDNTEETGDDS